MRVSYSEPAEAELEQAYLWLQSFGFDTAERWLVGLQQALEDEADLISSVALRRPLAPDAPEGRDLYLLLYRPTRRSGTPWHIVYELVDEDGDGAVEDLLVMTTSRAGRAGQRENNYEHKIT